MAERSGEHCNRIIGGWGIYDRLKKVPRLSSPKEVSSPRGRKLDSSESASETAARRMVEDLFKQEADAAEPLADFILIDHNEFVHRGHKKQEEEISVCECVCEDDNLETACGDQCLNVMTCTECTPGYCPSGELCRNQRFQHNQYANTKLVKTDNRGWGLATAQDLKAGDFVIEYCGEVVTQREAHIRGKSYEATGLKECYIMYLNRDEAIDSTHSGSFARFINHSCDPNCETIKWTVLGEDRIGIFAIKDICAETELTYDYKSQWLGGNRVRCACGANTCAGYFGTKSKSLQKDAYTWEDDAERKEVEDARRSDAEDDTPLCAFFDMGLVDGKSKTGGTMVSTKSGGNLTKTTMEKLTVSSSMGALVKNEAPMVTGAHGFSSVSPVATAVEKSTPVRRRGALSRRDNPSNGKALHLFGKFKDSHGTKFKKLGKVTRLNALEEEEMKVERRRARSDAEMQSGHEIAVSTDLLPPQNGSRIAGFQRARNALNKQLIAEFSSCFPVSEAACAEVEFAQEVETAAALDLRKVCEEIHPTVKECYKSGQNGPLMTLADKWMEARSKQLISSLNFHFSIVRHFAGRTYSLCNTKETPV